MAFVVADRVRENTLTTGTGTVTLTGAVTGFQSFAAIGNTNTTYYTIAHQTLTEWETGIGTYASSGTTLARTTVISSSNGGSLVNFSAGTKDVFVSPPASTYPIATGQAFYGFGAGTYSWTVPTNVTLVSVVCIGAGSGSQGAQWSNGGGGGGGLAYENNIVVVPGAIWTVTVGLGGDMGRAGSNAGGLSSFTSPTSVVAVQANGGSSGSVGGSGGTTLGYDGGGNGGNGNANYGGGGAGGYSGNGGAGNASGSGGGAAGGITYSSSYGAAGGGGVAPFGQGTSGTLNYGGAGGSGGESASAGENPTLSYGNITRPGGRYGGGGGGSGTSSPTGIGIQRGANGCVRIIWGAGRSFPSTGTGDM